MIIPVVPMPAPRMTQNTYWKHRKYFEWKDLVRAELPGYSLPVELVIVFHVPFPKSYSRKKRAELVGHYHDQKPDIDNLVKGFMDVFKKDEAGNATGDDKHVAVVHAVKLWAEEGAIELQ
jgi:Holliday junction resolvase RusA-like endonuclease